MYSPIKRIVTGIDVGTHSTRILVMEQSNDTAPRIIATGISETRGLHHGYIISKADAISSIEKALARVEKITKFKIKNVLLSVGGISLESYIAHGSLIISRVSGEINELDIQKIEAETKENLPNLTNRRIVYSTTIRYKIDNKEVLGSPIGMIGAKLEIKMLFVTYLEQHLDDMIHAIEKLGIEVDEVIPSPIIASQTILTKKQRSVGCALVNIGAETVSIVVFENDVPISLQVFPIGSTDITNDIALGFKIPLEDAENMKLGHITDVHPKKKLTEIIEARLYDIFELIEAHLKKIGRSGLLPAGIILTGGGSSIASIQNFSKATLKLPSSVANLPIENNKQIIKDSTWFVAYGLAQYALEKSPTKNQSSFYTIAITLKKLIKPFLP